MCTHDVVVLAADGLGRALVAGPDANDGDRGAVEADEDVEVLEDDAQKAEEGTNAGGRGLSHVVNHSGQGIGDEPVAARTDSTWSQHWMGPVEHES